MATSGQYDNPIPYSYYPESLIELFPLIRDIYQDVLGLGVYAVITQGLNEYGDPSLLHVSRNHNHISLNALGLAFAQLLAIDGAVRKAIRKGEHPPMDLYMDRSFYHSLQFERSRFDKNARPKYAYHSPIAAPGSHYFAETFGTIKGALRMR
jgi:hypothetical protein